MRGRRAQSVGLRLRTRASVRPMLIERRSPPLTVTHSAAAAAGMWLNCGAVNLLPLP